MRCGRTQPMATEKGKKKNEAKIIIIITTAHHDSNNNNYRKLQQQPTTKNIADNKWAATMQIPSASVVIAAHQSHQIVACGT